MTNCAETARTHDEQRLNQIASILAAGILRLRERQSLPKNKISEILSGSRPNPLELSGNAVLSVVHGGFSFLGYDFNQDGLIGVAEPTRNRFVERVHQLYEQGADQVRIGMYVRRWLVWVKSM